MLFLIIIALLIGGLYVILERFVPIEFLYWALLIFIIYSGVQQLFIKKEERICSQCGKAKPKSEFIEIPFLSNTICNECRLKRGNNSKQ